MGSASFMASHSCINLSLPCSSLEVDARLVTGLLYQEPMADKTILLC